MVPPPGYEILKPEDKNVDFGDEYEPEAGNAGDGTAAGGAGVRRNADTLIPPYLTLFPDQQIESPFVWDTGVYVASPTCRSATARRSS